MTAVDALQLCLAAEHAAVYGYGVVGGVLAGAAPADSPDHELAASAYVEHRRLRDELTSLVAAQGAEPVAAQPAYELPQPVGTVDDCRALARRIEQRCSQTYADAVSRTVENDRAFTARALTGCAVRAAAWGAPADPFPGITEV